MEKGSFSIRDRLKSFKYAYNGLCILFRQHNTRIHLIAAGIVLIMSWFYRINITEWCLVLICIGFVMITEGINTSIEYLADVVSPVIDQKIKMVKDVAAGAVLIAAIISLTIGLIIFLPKF